MEKEKAVAIAHNNRIQKGCAQIYGLPCRAGKDNSPTKLDS